MEEDNIEIEIENLLDKKNKKIKSGKKGKRVELEVVKLLNNRFAELLSKNPSYGRFSRTIGSGNRWGQNVYLSKTAMDNFSGDLVCPTNFKFIIESKGGYNDIDLCSAFEGGQSELDAFLKQASDDSERTNRKPMLLWKKDRKPRLSFIKSSDIEFDNYKNFEYHMKYRDWIGLSLNDLLKLPDSFFFLENL
jgi:hypothetical protein